MTDDHNFYDAFFRYILNYYITHNFKTGSHNIVIGVTIYFTLLRIIKTTYILV